MKVVDHRLLEAIWHPTAYKGANISPKFIVIHYTAGGSAESSMKAIEKRGLSAHLFIGRDGYIFQTVDFNKKAFHAGASEWQGYKELNGWAIGIECCNYGWLDEYDSVTGQRWRDENNDGIPETPKFSQGAYTVARHRNGGPKLGWENYPEVQMAAIEAACAALVAFYPGIKDICGHDEIAPTRKQDPGPAMDMARLRKLLQK